MTIADDLTRLEQMHERGKLSDDEFAKAKEKLLNSSGTHATIDGLNRFRRSREDNWIGGVCGGLAESTGLDSWIWRTLFAVLTLAGGSGLLIYLVLWIFVPEKT